MKLTFIFLLFVSLSKAQINPPILPPTTLEMKSDSLEQRIKYLENAFVSMRNHMRYSHLEHSGGVIFWFVGLAATGVSLAIRKDNKSANVVAIGGAAMNFIGFCLILDSHKWIGRVADIPLKSDRVYDY